MTRFVTLAAVLATAGLTGCVGTSPDWDASFGEAARTLSAQQVIAPEASLNPSPVSGIDGKAAQAAMGEYAKSYAQPQQQQTGGFTLGTGSSGR
ncbi:MAG: hypothetical protein AzoDbin1_00394 [Azoarcus sp.]|nr:hypothetical protein [Azoarcus sp.]